MHYPQTTDWQTNKQMQMNDSFTKIQRPKEKTKTCAQFSLQLMMSRNSLIMSINLEKTIKQQWRKIATNQLFSHMQSTFLYAKKTTYTYELINKCAKIAPEIKPYHVSIYITSTEVITYNVSLICTYPNRIFAALTAKLHDLA